MPTFSAGPVTVVAKAERPDNYCLDWQCGGWVTAAGVVENFFHQQNWREHKAKKLGWKKGFIDKTSSPLYAMH